MRARLFVVPVLLTIPWLVTRVNADETPAPLPSASASASAAPATSPAPTPIPTEAPKAVPPPPPPLEPAEIPAEKKPPQTDHDLVVGHFGFGYFGQFDATLATSRSAGTTTPLQLVGVRYWFSRVRLDLALGIGLGTGSAKRTTGDTTTSTDDASLLALGVRVALPFAVWVEKHYTVFIGPEVVYAHAGETAPIVSPSVPGSTPPPDDTHKGDRFSLGVRAGAEIQFGFIGLPRLALDASLGLALDYTTAKSTTTTSAGVGGSTQTTLERSRFSLSSSTSHQPWNIFISNVAAVYYF